MDCLYIVKGIGQGERFDLSDDLISIGRNQDCSIRLRDAETSRRHAEIRLREGKRVVVDLGSSNGVFLNGKRITEAELATGDQIQIGQTILAFNKVAEPSKEAEPVVDFDRSRSVSDPSRIVHTLKQDHGREIFDANVTGTQSDWFKAARAHLNLIYHTTLTVSQTLDINALLLRIMEMIFEWVDIDRGCILFYNAETKKLVPKVVKCRTPLPNEPFIIDQSIIDYVLTQKEGILTNEEQSQIRSEQLARQGVREAICVPMLGRYGLVGLIYIDYKRNDAWTFSTDHSVPSVERELISDNSATGMDAPFIQISTSEELEFTSGSPFTFQKPDRDTFIKVDSPEEKKGHAPNSLSKDHLKLMSAIGHQAALAVEDTQYYRAMLQSERLAAVGQTVAVLSHHIKNILQGIQGGSYLIKRGLNDHNETMVGKGWGIVEKNQEKISNLILDMLTFSKERTPVFELKDINKVAQDVGELMEGRGNDFDIAVLLHLDPSIPKFYFDADQIHRALTNLVTNAIDAAKPDSRFNPDIDPPSDRWSASESTDSAIDQIPTPIPTRGTVEITSKYLPEKKHVVLYVDDNGPGVPADLRDELFRPFFSKNKSGGTGLGLAVTHKIVQEHKGTIKISDSPIGGARFAIYLPFVDELPEK